LNDISASQIIRAHDNLRSATSLEEHSRSHAGDLLIVLRVHIGEDGVLPGRDLLGQLDSLGECHLAFLQRTAEIDLVDLFAEIDFLVEDADEAVLDLDVDFCAFFDVLGKRALSGDDEVVATERVLVLSFRLFVIAQQGWDQTRRWK